MLAPKETPQTPKKSAPAVVGAFLRAFTGFQLSKVVIPSVNEFIASPTVRCFASLAALPRRSPGGKGAEPPITPRQAPAPNPASHPSWAGSARSAHLARPRLPARAAYLSPILPRKMGHIRKACVVSGRNLPSIGMAARIGRPKSPRGFASGRYLILRL